jgi:hypothetical protein
MKSFLQKVILNVRNQNRLRNNLRSLLRIFIATKIRMPWLSLKLIRIYSYIRVPFRQLIILDTALKVTDQLKNANIEFVILGGTLLGAVRQGAFAGRPGDFDIGIKEADVSKVLLLENELAHFRLKLINKPPLRPSGASSKGSLTVLPMGLEKVLPLRCQVQIMVYEFKDGAWIWQRWSADFHDMSRADRNATIQFPIPGSKIESSIFGHNFPIPENTEEYLSICYGADWRTPNVKQFGPNLAIS